MANMYQGTSNADLLWGTESDDVFFGNGGADTFYGNGGNDIFHSNADFTSDAYGGTGNDTYVATGAALKPFEFYGEGTDTFISAIGGTTDWRSLDLNQYNIEIMILTESAGAANILANDLENRVVGNSSANLLTGEKGNDTIEGGGGGDAMDGGDGTDTVTYTHANSVSVFLNAVAPNAGDATGDTFTSIERVIGSKFDDLLAGNSVANTLSGGNGDDQLLGYKGKDSLNGGDGKDSLSGGAGIDKLTGGAGNDQFRFSETVGSTNADTITDFKHGDDKIALNAQIFAALGSSITSSEFGAKTSGHVAGDNQHIIYDKSNGTLWYDADDNGNGAAVLFATLSNKPQTLTYSDFLVLSPG